MANLNQCYCSVLLHVAPPLLFTIVTPTGTSMFTTWKNLYIPVADLGGVAKGGANAPPLAAMNFCIRNHMSPSNDCTAVPCSNNNQAQLHIHISVPY